MQEGNQVKNKINNKLLIMATVSSMVLSGCVSKTIIVPNSNVKAEKKSGWNVKSKAKEKNEDCLDCYATVFKENQEQRPIAKQRKAKNTYSVVNDFRSAHENKSFSKKKSIQVGAFRKYAGAKVYAKRYSLLTNEYNVDIKKNVKNHKPIYRVQIEGFSSEREAENFMARYGLNGAFLVRR